MRRIVESVPLHTAILAQSPFLTIPKEGMMADYGAVQISLKSGSDLLNVAGDSVEELRSRLDQLFGVGAGEDMVARFFVVQAFATSSDSDAQATATVTTPTSNNNSPTDKQIKFAKTLGIQNADKLTRRELSAEIDRRKA